MGSPLGFHHHRFQRGDQVEVSSNEEGFRGSYYPATVVTVVRVGRTPTHYRVQYHTLVADDDAGELLTELVPAGDVRPAPPLPPAEATFGRSNTVDAFDNDGWWTGRITGTRGDHCYVVYFDTTGDEVAYPLSRLRPHQEYVNGKWA